MDETSDITSIYDSESPGPYTPRFEDRSIDQSISSDNASQVSSRPQGSLQSIGTESLARPTPSSRINQPLRSYDHPLSIEQLTDQGSSPPSHQHGHQMYGLDHSASTIPQIYSSAPVWPLTDPSEALLLRHFVQNLAIWVRNAYLFCPTARPLLIT